MTKYIRLIKEIQNYSKKVILRFDKCNDCPLMVYDKKNLTVSCRKFSNGVDRIINNSILDNGKKGIKDKIEIPEFCGLKNNIYDLEESNDTYLITEQSVLISRMQCEKNLPIYNISNLKKITEVEKDKYDFSPNPTVNSNLFDDILEDTDYEDEDEDDDNDNDNINNDIMVVCSVCGGYSVDINRNVNNGMCLSCFDIYKDNDYKIKQSYVNNFRIKRGIMYVNKNFKLV